MDEEDEHSPSEFSVIVNIWKLLTQKRKRALPKSGGHRRFYQPTEKCKHKQEKGY